MKNNWDPLFFVLYNKSSSFAVDMTRVFTKVCYSFTGVKNMVPLSTLNK